LQALWEGKAHPARRPDAQAWDTRSDRLTRWSLWVHPLTQEERTYFAELGWPEPQVVGIYRRQVDDGQGVRQTETRLWLAGGAWDLTSLSPATWLAILRGHWQIENSLFYVLDRTWREDAHGARFIAKMLHVLRVWVTTWLRRMGFRYVPDGQRCMEAHDQDLLLWLLYGVWPQCVNS